MELVKIYNNTVVFKSNNSIITEEISDEAIQILNYYNRIPANM